MAETSPAAEWRRERPADTFERVAGRRGRRRRLGERENRRVRFDAAFEPENRRARPLRVVQLNQFRLIGRYTMPTACPKRHVVPPMPRSRDGTRNAAPSDDRLRGGNGGLHGLTIIETSSQSQGHICLRLGREFDALATRSSDRRRTTSRGAIRSTRSAPRGSGAGRCNSTNLPRGDQPICLEAMVTMLGHGPAPLTPSTRTTAACWSCSVALADSRGCTRSRHGVRAEGLIRSLSPAVSKAPRWWVARGCMAP